MSNIINLACCLALLLLSNVALAKPDMLYELNYITGYGMTSIVKKDYEHVDSHVLSEGLKLDCQNISDQEFQEKYAKDEAKNSNHEEMKFIGFKLCQQLRAQLKDKFNVNALVDGVNDSIKNAPLNNDQKKAVDTIIKMVEYSGDLSQDQLTYATYYSAGLGASFGSGINEMMPNGISLKFFDLGIHDGVDEKKLGWMNSLRLYYINNVGIKSVPKYRLSTDNYSYVAGYQLGRTFKEKHNEMSDSKIIAAFIAGVENKNISDQVIRTVVDYSRYVLLSIQEKQG